MLVEINLLPKKEVKRKNIVVLLALILFIFLLIGFYLFWQYHHNKAKLAVTEEQYNSTMAVIEAETKQLQTYESSNSVQKLQEAIKWAELQDFNSVFLLSKLTSSLPERGFITEFEMDENYKITQMVQFDTKNEAAYYLNTLQDYNWVDEAVITTGKTTDVLKDDESRSEETVAAIDRLNQADILPRYFATFEIRINKDDLEKAAKKDTEEGSDTP